MLHISRLYIATTAFLPTSLGSRSSFVASFHKRCNRQIKLSLSSTSTILVSSNRQQPALETPRYLIHWRYVSTIVHLYIWMCNIYVSTISNMCFYELSSVHLNHLIIFLFTYCCFNIYISRGEHKEAYSHSFRQWEFLSALSATIAEKKSSRQHATDILHSLKESTTFTNTYTYNPYINNKKGELPSTVDLGQVQMYNEALQYIQFSSTNDNIITTDIIKRATERCSLVHSSYIVLAEPGNSYSELVKNSLQSKAFKDMIQTSSNDTWRIRHHEFGFVDDPHNPHN